MKGDGSVYKSRRSSYGEFQGYSYQISLRVKSREFAEHFADQCAAVLGRKATKICGPYSDGCVVSKYSSVDFFVWWKSLDFEGIKRIARLFPRDYLRGRYDSEAGVASYEVYMHGAITHREVLQLDRDLCVGLGLRTGPLLPYGRTTKRSFIHGREIFPTFQKLRFTVNAKDFIEKIGSIIVKERNKKLHGMIKGRRWTPWGNEIRSEALRLLDGGLVPKAASDEIHRTRAVTVPPITIYFWSRGTKSWEKYAEEAKEKLNG